MSFSSFKHAKIKGILTVLPDHCIHIDDEIRFYDNDPKKLARNKKILGLEDRYVLPQGLTCLDLCEEAAKRLITDLKLNKDEIDGIIVASNCHEFASPADACILQGRLGLSENCTCFDIGGLSCSAYVHALMTAHSFIETGVMKKCLVLAGDMNSIHSDVRNRNSNMLYSDSGSATLVEYSEKEYPSWFQTGTRGSGWAKIITPGTGVHLPIRKDIADIEITDSNGNVWHLWDEVLKGFDIFQFTMYAAPKSIRETLEYAGKNIDDIDYFPMHQANGQIVKTIAQHAKIPEGKSSGETFSKYANCGAASIVSAICDQLKDKNVKDIMLVTFGVGLSWGTCIVDFSNVFNGGVQFFEIPENLPTRAELIEKWIGYFKGENDV